MAGHLIRMDSKRKSRQICETRDKGHGEEEGPRRKWEQRVRKLTKKNEESLAGSG
jgi:hypothetical protein